MREEELDWSQSKIFLVSLLNFQSPLATSPVMEERTIPFAILCRTYNVKHVSDNVDHSCLLIYRSNCRRASGATASKQRIQPIRVTVTPPHVGITHMPLAAVGPYAYKTYNVYV